MTGPILKVDPTVLRQVGSAFGQMAGELADLAPGQALDDAATGVSQLLTAAACQAAQQALSAEVAAAANDARQFGMSLTAAADQYLRQDEASASAVEGVQI